MAISAGVLLLVATFVAALAAVRMVFRRPIALSAPLALAVMVVFEGLLLGLLSRFEAVSAPAIFGAHAAAVAAAAGVAWSRGARARSLIDLGRRSANAVRTLGPPGILIVPVALLAAISALRYLPNNWDSMTYRLARIAHWIQHRSVDAYPTHVDRQLVLQPGAEYLLVSLQVMTGTDRLDALLQFGAWLVVILASPFLARLAGAPRRLAPWAAVVVAALPMGVLQASSTQTDLVASALALAVIVAAVPFLHRAPRWTIADAAFLGIAIGAAALVKTTALVAAAPFLVFALVRAALAAPRRLVVACAVVAIVAAAPVVPEVVRRSRPDLERALKGHAAVFVYTGFADIPDRLLNLGRGIVRHLPSSPALVAAVGVEGWCRPGEELCRGLLLRPHEDNAGNPFHVVLVLLAAGVAVVRWRRLPARARGFLLATAGAWVLFHFAFRDNTWISRLETPTFVLAGLTLAAFGRRPAPAVEVTGSRKRGKGATRALAPTPPPGLRAAIAVAATLALVFGARTALDNEIRPPLAGAGGPESYGYYANLPNLGRAHDAVLRYAEAVRCPRIGLFIGGDSYDYPLTWRAMQQGWEVRHVFGADPWPCLVFSDQPKLPGTLEALGWTRSPLPFVFLNTSYAGATPTPFLRSRSSL
jgi:hypothetical protein